MVILTERNAQAFTKIWCHISMCPTDQCDLPPHLYRTLSNIRGEAKIEVGIPFIGEL